MKKLIIASLLLFVLVKVNAQDDKKSKLIADETEAFNNGKTYKVVTENEMIFRETLKKYDQEIKQYTVRYKYDRHGKTIVYTIYFYPDKAEEIGKFINKL